MGFGLNVFVESSQSCCTEITTAIDQECPQEEKSNCCGSSSCDCLCCSHIFTCSKICVVNFADINYCSTLVVADLSEYSHFFLHGVWQPPQSV